MFVVYGYALGEKRGHLKNKAMHVEFHTRPIEVAFISCVADVDDGELVPGVEFCQLPDCSDPILSIAILLSHDFAKFGWN